MNEPRVVLTPASAIAPKRAPWPHYPHCPNCHQRLWSKDPDASRRARRGEPILLPTADGRCPHCRTKLADWVARPGAAR